MKLPYVSKTEFDRLLADIGDHPTRLLVIGDIIRLNALYMVRFAGSGHLGSSFSSADIFACMFFDQLENPNMPSWEKSDLFWSSKGHDAPAYYAALILLGILPEESIHQLRRLGGLPGHPDISLPGIVSNSGSLGMGIADAIGFALARTLRGKTGSISVLLGDGELQEGMVWESLQVAAHHRLDIRIIVDVNHMQSDTWIKDTVGLRSLSGKFSEFGCLVEECDGHNPADILRALSATSRGEGHPRVVIAETVKGKGISFMEATSENFAAGQFYPYHSGAPSFEECARAANEIVLRLQKTVSETGNMIVVVETDILESGLLPIRRSFTGWYAEELVRAGEELPHLVVLDADLAKDCGVTLFRARFPNRFFEMGIAEMTMVTTAGAMARSGLLPVVHSFGAFLSARAREQIFKNATERTRVVYAAFLSGLLPAGPGHSHQEVNVCGTLSGIPDLVIYDPACGRELSGGLEFALKQHSGSSYLRLSSFPCSSEVNSLLAHTDLPMGVGVLRELGNDGLLITHGPVMLTEVLFARRIIAERTGKQFAVCTLPWLNRVDEVWLRSLLRSYAYQVVATVEDHMVDCGQGVLIAAAIGKICSQDQVAPPKMALLGVEGIAACGTPEEVLRHHRLDAQSIAQRVSSFL